MQNYQYRHGYLSKEWIMGLTGLIVLSNVLMAAFIYLVVCLIWQD